MKPYEIKIDLKNQVDNKSMAVNTNDLNSLKFDFTITQDGQPYDLTGKTVRIAIVKPDKTTVFADCTISDALNGLAEIILGSQAYIVPGLHVAEVMIYEGTDTVVVTTRFTYNSVKGILDDSTIESTNEFQSINKAIADVEGVLTDIRENGTGVDAQAREELNSVSAELAQTSKSINERSILVTDFGAVGDGITNNTSFFREALSIANSHEYTLFIPAGGFYISDKIEINCNVVCMGEILIPNNVEKTFVEFPRGESKDYIGANLFDEVNKGDSKLSLVSNVTESPLFYNSYFCLESTEILMNRIGSSAFTPYTKNESGELSGYDKVNKRFNIRDFILHDYADLNNLTVTLTKKLPFLNVDGLRVRRINKGTNGYNQELVKILRNNINFKNLFINNEAQGSLKNGILLDKTHNITFDGGSVYDVYGAGDVYPLMNRNSAYIHFKDFDCDQGDISGIVGGYVGRHGSHISFDNCNLFGIDDHYGAFYDLNRTTISLGDLSFAGNTLKVRESDFKNSSFGFSLRQDTPFAEGDLIFENVTFDNVQRPMQYTATSDPDNRLPGIPLKFFDNIKIKDITVKNTYKERAQDINNTSLLEFTTVGGGWHTPQTVQIGKIVFEDIDSDIKLINFSSSIPTNIDEIIFNNIKIKPTIPYDSIYGRLFRMIGAHTINKINIIKTDEGSYRIPSEATINEINTSDSKLTESTTNHWQCLPEETLSTFKNCHFGNLRCRFNNKLIFKDNIFGFISYAMGIDTATILLSRGNVAEVDVNVSYIPVLDGYVNATYYKTS